MNKTSIEWTDFSANPLKYRNPAGEIVWGCVHASRGCDHCYAETLAKRYGRGGPFNVQTMNTLTPFLDEGEIRKMLTAKRIGGKDVAGSRCFVGDMTDVFGPWVSDELLDRLFAVFALRPDVTWQVLTKRAKRMREYLSGAGVASRIAEQAQAIFTTSSIGRMDQFKIYPVGPNAEFGNRWFIHPWPLPNLWGMVSAERQEEADERIPELLQTPVAVRGVSLEPLLGPINLREMAGHDDWHIDALDCPDKSRSLDWLIPGGESGHGARPCDVAWIRSIVQQGQAAGVATFVKQLGSKPTADYGNHFLTLRDRKGGDTKEWPADLQVRQFPEVRR